MKEDRSINFTKGNIAKNLFLFALPILAGEILQNLYNSVDSWVVGNFIGDTELAAVSVCSNISNLLIAIFNGLSLGNTVAIGRIYGSGDDEGAKKAISVTFTFSIMLGMFLSALGIIFAPLILSITGANEVIFESAMLYLRVYLAGLMFTVIYNCGAGTLRAIGDSKSPFRVLVFSSCFNMALDILFVRYLNLGIFGVGFATLIAQCFSALLIYLSIAKTINHKAIDFKELFLHGWKTVGHVLRIGFPASINGAIISTSNIFVWRYINMLTTSEVAGIGVAMRVEKFIAACSKSIGMAMTTYTGQNVGAGFRHHLKRGMFYCAVMAFISIGTIDLLLTCFSENIISFFNTNPDVIRAGSEMLKFMAPFYFFAALREILMGVMRGCSIVLIPVILSLTGMVIIRQIYLYFAFPIHANIRIIYIAYPIAWVASTLLIGIYYCLVRKRIHQDASDEEE